MLRESNRRSNSDLCQLPFSPEMFWRQPTKNLSYGLPPFRVPFNLASLLVTHNYKVNLPICAKKPLENCRAGRLAKDLVTPCREQLFRSVVNVGASFYLPEVHLAKRADTMDVTQVLRRFHIGNFISVKVLPKKKKNNTCKRSKDKCATNGLPESVDV